MTILTDDIIKRLLEEEKTIPKDFAKRIKTKPKSGQQYDEQELDVMGKDGDLFSIILRKNRIDFLDFSIILRYHDSRTGNRFNLARYNGKHAHTNPLEGDKFHDFHTHLATQRYQEAGLRIEAYAKATRAYHSFNEALDAFLSNFRFRPELPETAKTLGDFGGG
jgi:hypothetical protein